MILVSMSGVAESEEFRKEMKAPFVMICDKEMMLYSEFSLKKASTLSFFSPKLLLKGFGAMAEGYKLSTPKGDPKQLGGEVLIDKKGHIRWFYQSKDPSDNPPVELILKAAEKSGLTGR